MALRITIINQFYTPDISPTAHLSASLANHLSHEGHEVTVVASWGGYVPASPQEVRDERRGNPRIHRVWTPKLGKSTILKRCVDYGAFYLLATWRLLTLPRQDVIISLTTPPYIAWAALLHKVIHPSAKVVLWSMDCYPDAAERMNVIRRGSLGSRVMRWMNRAMFRRLDHLICLDTAMKDLLLSQYADPSRALPASIIPNWENADLFPGNAKPARWPKAEPLGLGNRFVVLYLGNTGYGHQFDAVLDAATELRHEPVTFLFIGGGKRWSELEAAQRERRLDNIILHGYVPKEETPSVMAGADAALITLRDDALGVMSPSKLHANLAMGLPVIYIGPATSNVDDALARYQCGVSLRNGDSAGIVAFVRAHFARGAAFHDLRARARRAFDEAYVDRRTLPRFSDIIAVLAGEAPARHHEASAPATH